MQSTTEYMRAYRANNRERLREYNRKWMKKSRNMKKHLTTSIKYEIRYEKPSNYEALLSMFSGNLNFDLGSVITYEGVIYTKDPIPDHVLAHELVHIRRQREYQGTMEEYLQKYMTDLSFRMKQEVEAFQEEYRYYITHTPKHKHINFLWYLASALSKSYGIEGLTDMEAYDLIKSGINQPSIIV